MLGRQEEANRIYRKAEGWGGELGPRGGSSTARPGVADSSTAPGCWSLGITHFSSLLTCALLPPEAKSQWEELLAETRSHAGALTNRIGG